ncbi:MAG: 3-phosphoshikimate 1-carboxyvinyltransferase [Gammaproteobacteria bacterium]|jgi:3-phosphoshikimate 1-carboxyvinyltransferase
MSDLIFKLPNCTEQNSLRGDALVPGDKSVSHRSIMFGALADGVTNVSGFLTGEDCLATLKAFRAMGVEITDPVDGKLTINGVGMRGLKAPQGELDLGNSGTSMRLMSGLLAAQNFDCVLTGDHSLQSRPMKRVTGPLAEMGATITTEEDGTAPLKIIGGAPMEGIHYTSPVASAQIKSCLLLAGLYADGETCVTEPGISRDHSERMLKAFGYAIECADQDVRLIGGGKLVATDIEVPGDISSAAFLLVAASIRPGSELLLRNVGINPTRTGVIDILRLMGADISEENSRMAGGEPVADLRVKYAPLKGIRIPEALVPLAIDEFPVLFIAAAFAEGETLLTGARELRVKESDRIQVMADGLQAMGVECEVLDDGMRIVGQSQPTGGSVAVVHSHADHRIAMSFSVAALRSTCEIEIHDCQNVNTSFPGFADLMQRLGLHLEVLA